MARCSLPSISDPFDLRRPEFSVETTSSAGDWLTALKAQVAAQFRAVRANPSLGGFLAAVILTGQLMAVPIPGGDAGKPGVAQALFRTGLNPSSAMDQIAVSADGKGFLLRRPVESDDNEAPVQVVLNWRGLLKR